MRVATEDSQWAILTWAKNADFIFNVDQTPKKRAVPFMQTENAGYQHTIVLWEDAAKKLKERYNYEE